MYALEATPVPLVEAEGAYLPGGPASCPVTKNMAYALEETWAAIPEPRIAIAVGACAISGGPFAGGTASGSGVPKEIPVNLFVPGCPPHPFSLLDGLLRALGRIG